MSVDLYKRSTSFVLGFHGCDRSVGEAVLNGKEHLVPSANDYDWLGEGVYFWEGNPARAFDFATQAAGTAKRTTKGRIQDPFVVGAIIDLGICFSLQDSACLAELPVAYEFLKSMCEATGVAMPQNQGAEKVVRYLDCAVIKTMHQLRRLATPPLVDYDTVRCAFTEGQPLYDGGCFSEKAHVQIAVRNPEKCILGYFRPQGM
jgi:hypothetical protein